MTDSLGAKPSHTKQKSPKVVIYTRSKLCNILLTTGRKSSSYLPPKFRNAQILGLVSKLGQGLNRHVAIKKRVLQLVRCYFSRKVQHMEQTPCRSHCQDICKLILHPAKLNLKVHKQKARNVLYHPKIKCNSKARVQREEVQAHHGLKTPKSLRLLHLSWMLTISVGFSLPSLTLCTQILKTVV